jgi:hypothetical protein
VCTACTSKEQSARDALQAQLDDVESRLDDCDKAQAAADAKANELADSDADIAEAKYVDKTSPQEEWEIRREKASQTDLLPSEVNGWKQEKKDAAATAKRKLSYQQQAASSAAAQTEAPCRNAVKLLDQKSKLEDEINKVG